jgi:glycosyltransferase involved in cell wall biosynthesis
MVSKMEMMEPCKVLHVVSDSFWVAGNAHSGGAKGIQIFKDYLLDRGIPFDEVAAPGRSDAALLKVLKGLPIERYRAFLVHYPFYPRSLRYLKRRAPGRPILLRSHNAEFLHWMDQALGWLEYGRPWLAMKHVKQALWKLWGDWRCGRMADHLLAITTWEVEHYWARLGVVDNVHYVPYFNPVASVPTNVPSYRGRDTQIVCPLALNQSSHLIDAGRHFFDAVRSLGDELPYWQFAVTGKLESFPFPLKAPRRAEALGFVDDMSGLLGRARAVAVLSDYGHGFKTKILEAMEYGCRVLVPPTLFGRLPDEVRPYCLVVDPNLPDSFRSALQKLEAIDDEVPGAEINARFKELTIAVLDDLLLTTVS